MNITKVSHSFRWTATMSESNASWFASFLFRFTISVWEKKKKEWLPRHFNVQLINWKTTHSSTVDFYVLWLCYTDEILCCNFQVELWLSHWYWKIVLHNKAPTKENLVDWRNLETESLKTIPYPKRFHLPQQKKK